MRRLLVVKPSEPVVEFVQTSPRAILTVRESELKPGTSYEGALVRFIPETSSAERVATELVPALMERGAAAVRVAPKQAGEQAVITTAPDEASPVLSVREAVEAVAARARNVDPQQLRACLSSALTEAGL